MDLAEKGPFSSDADGDLDTILDENSPDAAAFVEEVITAMKRKELKEELC